MGKKQIYQALGRQLQKLLAVEEKLILADKGEDTMLDQSTLDLLAAIDSATNRIAARIQKLIDAGNLTPEINAALQAEVDKLNLLGADPVTPVPAGV